MIRLYMRQAGELAKSFVFVFVFVFVSITSCTNGLPEEAEIVQLHDVSVSLTGINFTIEPLTRASDATAANAGISRIALKVYDEKGGLVASVSQIASEVGEDFNNLSVKIPAGTYTFVAVAHSATDDNVACATITSATEATLPEGIVPTLYSKVLSKEITNANNQNVTLDMGKRINATFHLASTDKVPEGVTKMAVDVNPGGTYVGDASPARFNPTTGFVIGNPNYRRAISVTVGQFIDGEFNILLPADTYQYPMKVSAMNASNKTIADYTRTFDNVPFQRAYVTNASGTFFRYVSNSILTFDISTDNQNYDY